MKMKHTSWEERFDKEVKKLDKIGAMYHKFGYKTRIRHIDGSKEIYTVTDWGNVKKFIHEVLSEQKKEIREKFTELAIKGGADRDEMKGLLLYTRFLKYLNETH